MAIEYRDYGKITYKEPNTNINVTKGADSVPVEAPTSQVYKATHDGTGKRLSHMNRSFISFTYGGKYIEDFGFIATIDGNMMSGNTYAEFTDNVTESEVFDGQIYWSTHFNNNSISFSLATDGITETEFDAFKAWFAPGIIRELVLMERPNRAILARVSSVPAYNLIPFEHKTTVKLAGNDYETSTTLYKGSISLELVMDDPFWYSLHSFLSYEHTVDGTTFLSPGQTIDANGEVVHIFDDKDALKMILEDGVPIADTWLKNKNTAKKWYGTSLDDIDDSIFIGDRSYAIKKNNSSSYTGTGPTGSFVAKITDNAGDTNSYGAWVDHGHVAFPLIKDTKEKSGVILKYYTKVLDKDNTTIIREAGPQYCYYGGNAPSYPIIHFKIRPRVYTGSKSAADNGYQIVLPWNTYGNGSDAKGNSIFFQGIKTKRLFFSLPSIWNGYCQAIKILKENDFTNKVELRQLLRESVKHYAPREYAINLLDTYNNKSDVIEAMLKFLSINDNDILTSKDPDTGSTNSVSGSAAEITIDCKTGIAKGIFFYRGGPSTGIEEDVSDMIKSNYICLDEKSQLDENGYIKQRTSQHPEYGYLIYTDYSYIPSKTYMEDFYIEYKYMYY